MLIVDRLPIRGFCFNLSFAPVFREEEDHDDETESGRESSVYVKPDIEELEMLLEAYFVQIDGTLNTLYHVCSSSSFTKGFIFCL